jgi:hypothetical protein
MKDSTSSPISPLDGSPHSPILSHTSSPVSPVANEEANKIVVASIEKCHYAFLAQDFTHCTPTMYSHEKLCGYHMNLKIPSIEIESVRWLCSETNAIGRSVVGYAQKEFTRKDATKFQFKEFDTKSLEKNRETLKLPQKRKLESESVIPEKYKYVYVCKTAEDAIDLLTAHPVVTARLQYTLILNFLSRHSTYDAATYEYELEYDVNIPTVESPTFRSATFDFDELSRELDNLD